jgi:hypothetical protein
MSETLIGRLQKVEKQLRQFSAKFGEIGFDTKKVVTSEFKKRWRTMYQAPSYYGLYLAVCVDTVDPMQQGRVRFFNPFMNHPDTTADTLSWAWPVSTMGGFDDSGCNWVPPAGSMLVMAFDRGHRGAAFYLGTTWSRYRGPQSETNFNFDIREYYKIHNGHRKGYLVGQNDESQVLPPWNTENYNTFDYNSTLDYEKDPDFKKNQTYPHIYGFKTPQKHMVKMVDGNYKCNHKWKRFELLSSCGGHMIFKDDHLHPAIQWTNPNLQGEQNGPGKSCNDKDGNPIEKPEQCPVEDVDSQKTPRNPYFKHRNEARPYIGPGTPQNNKVELEQTGWQVLSISGHTMIMDDSVEEPQGVPNWERSQQSFDFGCTDKFLGFTKIISATGHLFEISDREAETELRGEENYMRLKTALGNSIELNDHSVKDKLAGKYRGITMRSTSNHSFEMIDNLNEQGEMNRTGGQEPDNKARRAFVKVRTGYGLEIALNDCLPSTQAGSGADGSQTETINQHIQIFCPQKDNTKRGPHIMRFQEVKDGPGQVFLRVGGDYVCSTYDNHVTVVGDKDENPSNKITEVSQHTVISTEKFYYNAAETHAFIAKKLIFLMAGEDCVPVSGDKCQPCVWPVLCLSPKGVTISDRVYVSASPDAECASIFHMLPFHSCTPWKKCNAAELTPQVQEPSNGGV